MIDTDTTNDTPVPTEGSDAGAEAAGQMPVPDPALRRLDVLVGEWTITGNLIGSTEENIVGHASFRWLEGGFFLVQDVEIDFAGMYRTKGHELIGYDPETGAFASQVYSNLAPTPLPYRWDLRDRTLRISVTFGPLDATMEGTISEDGNTFTAGWRPNPGADETVNVPYDIRGSRVT
jgi:hypothetical protein